MNDNVDKNFDNLSDDDFMNLSEEDFLKGQNDGASADDENNQTPSENPEENLAGGEDSISTENAGNDTVADGANEDPSATPEGGEQSQNQEGNAAEGPPFEAEPSDKTPQNAAQDTGQSSQDGRKAEEGVQEQEDKNKKAEPNEGNKSGGDTLQGLTQEQSALALGFYQAFAEPIKADGKDYHIRSPEDAVRFIQQGVNYSRRMQELKPLRNLHRMMQENGIADQNTLNFLIEVNRGDKAAITKLLKDKGVDPLDLDVSKETGYQANNYAGDPKANDLQDALEETIRSPEGKELINDIHDTWDDASKAVLRDHPDTLGSLMEQKVSGVYGKIVAELDYQRAQGCLTQVPFLQAYNQVGQAMQKAGVFGPVEAQPQSGMAPMQTQVSEPASQPANPIAEGPRKAAQPKMEQPNPHLSSTPSSNAAPAVQSPNYGAMSDADFMKLVPPA
jgi:hypothetical protein